MTVPFVIRRVCLLTSLSNIAESFALIITIRMKDDVISIPTFLFCWTNFRRSALAKLETISLKPDIKKQLRDFIDLLYDEYVGIHLKSKKFIDSLGDWGNILKR